MRSDKYLFESYINVQRIVVGKFNKEEWLSSSEGIKNRVTQIAVEHMVYCLGIGSGVAALKAIGTTGMMAT